MSWAQRRKFIYLGTIAIIFIIIAVWVFVAYFYKPPTCFDGKKNQDELGIDCGGVCDLLCNSQYSSLNILWSRFSKVSDGVYNVLAYIVNPNTNAGVDNLDYVFKLYDKEGVLLRERFGTTFAPANRVIAVFEPELLTGNHIPNRVEFSFRSQAVWTKQMSLSTGISVSQSVISREGTSPRLTATLTNTSINRVRNLEAVGIIYNNEDNTIAFSRTVIDLIEGKESKDINFNWPKPFGDVSSRTEIILRVLK